MDVLKHETKNIKSKNSNKTSNKINKTKSYFQINKINILNRKYKEIKILQNKIQTENKIFLKLKKEKEIESEKYKKILENHNQMERNLEKNFKKHSKIKMNKIKNMNSLINIIPKNIINNINTDLLSTILKIEKISKENKISSNYLSSENLMEISLLNKEELRDFIMHFEDGINLMKKIDYPEYNNIKIYLENYLLEENTVHPIIDLVNYLYYICLDIEQSEIIGKIKSDINTIENNKNILYIKIINIDKSIIDKEGLILKISEEIKILNDSLNIIQSHFNYNRNSNSVLLLNEKNNNLDIYYNNTEKKQIKRKNYENSNKKINKKNESLNSLHLNNEQILINFSNLSNLIFNNLDLSKKKSSFYSCSNNEKSRNQFKTQRNFNNDYDLTEKPIKKISIFESLDIIYNNDINFNNLEENKNKVKTNSNILQNANNSNLIYSNKINIKKPFKIKKFNKYFTTDGNGNHNKNHLLNSKKEDNIKKHNINKFKKRVHTKSNILNINSKIINDKSCIKEINKANYLLYKKVKLNKDSLNNNNTNNTTISTNKNNSFDEQREVLNEKNKDEYKLKKCKSKMVNKKYKKIINCINHE